MRDNYNSYSDYQQYIGKKDLSTIEKHFKQYISLDNDTELYKYDIWVYYKKQRKLEKGYKLTKTSDNLLYLSKEIKKYNKIYTSNTIVELGKVIIFYGNDPSSSSPKKQELENSTSLAVPNTKTQQLAPQNNNEDIKNNIKEEFKMMMANSLRNKNNPENKTNNKKIELYNTFMGF